MTNYFFEGARADLSKMVSPNPAFQVTHSFSLGQKSNYTLGALFANQSTFMHGQWDPSTGGVNMRANQTWSESDVTKIQAQVSFRNRRKGRARSGGEELWSPGDYAIVSSGTQFVERLVERALGGCMVFERVHSTVSVRVTVMAYCL